MLRRSSTARARTSSFTAELLSCCSIGLADSRAAGSSLDGVVKVNAYVTDLTRFAEFNEVYREFFRHEPPARTTVATALLGFLVEIDCIAQLHESG